MDAKRAFRHAAKYALLKSLAALLGLLPAAVGGFYAYATYTTADANGTQVGLVFYGGVALLLVGLLVWQLVAAWALYHTITDAITESVAETYDTEKVKSDILSVLDSRLSDVQSDIQRINHSVQDVTRPDEEFSFDE